MKDKSKGKWIFVNRYPTCFAWFVLQVCQCAWQLIMRLWLSEGDIRCQMSSPHVRCQTQGSQCREERLQRPWHSDWGHSSILHWPKYSVQWLIMSCSPVSGENMITSACHDAAVTGLCLTNELWNLTLNTRDKNRIAITGHTHGITANSL